MNVTMETKKEEAISRMKALRLFAPCIRTFDKRNELQLSEPTGGLYEFSTDKELTEKVKEFEKEYNSLVYHVIHTPCKIDGEFMDMYSFLYVSDYPDEYDIDNTDIKDGYAMVYTWNKTIEYFSEFGSIAWKNMYGGIVRVL